MFRDSLTSVDRALPVKHYIDPGFVNHRLIETVVGEPGSVAIRRMIAEVPHGPDWMRTTQINHVFTRVILAFCTQLSIPPLGCIIAQGKGRLFCSTEQLGPVPSVYDDSRVEVPVVLDGVSDPRVCLMLGTEHITSDTLRMKLHKGGLLSVIAAMPQVRQGVLSFEPLVIGTPWLEIDDPTWADRIIWYGHEFFEHFIEDVDEFSAVKETPVPSLVEAEVMRRVSEASFKSCLAEILGDVAVVDWGGETCDHFTAHIHIQGRPSTAAFLLKGPAHYAPMTLNHLGKNNDQIYRLAQSPADVLFVQHCHEITPPVRATLRAFAVQPSRPRRYCFIDGRDSLRLLRAYRKLDKALDRT